jgi:predicted Zn-dependent protease
VTGDDLKAVLGQRAPGQWELYRKSAETREIEASPAFQRAAWRREEGWAARWWEAGAPRFAAASDTQSLALALPEAARIAVAAQPPPHWPSQTAALAGETTVNPPPELFEDLSRAVAAASRGEAVLAGLRLRRGRAEERIVNAAGLDVTQDHRILDGIALCVARRPGRAREVRVPFRWESEPEVETLARRLSDAATLPLSDRPAPFSSGQWLLDPAVGASLLGALAPLFLDDTPPRWIVRERMAGPVVGIADDASREAAFDGEGVATRRMQLIEDGVLVGRLHDLSSARRAGGLSTGHGVRPSFRMPPVLGPRRLFFETKSPSPPAALLSAITKGLFASALTAPPRVDLAADRYEIEFTGVSIVAGRAQGPVAGARSRGRVSELLRRIAGLSTDLQFFPSPFLVGSPTVYVERASFE